MKCLRCGREIGNNKECDCGHFYETNLKKKFTKHRKRHISLIEILAITIIGLVFLGIVIPYIINNKNNKEYIQRDYCTKVCEGTLYNIKNNMCYCSNGQTYTISK